MSQPLDNTASFLLRFTQNIYSEENGESNIQWRGKITHVQGGDKKNFTEVEDAIEFIQSKLSKLTLDAVDGKTEEEKEGIIAKSFDIWRKLAKESPKFVMDAIKDPKGQVSQIQDQLSQVGDEISQKIELDAWRSASKTDIKSLLDKMDKVTAQISTLTKKVDKLSGK